MYLFYAVFVFILGLIIGSFLGVVIDRLPRKESIVVGRSHCDACHTTLKPLDLIPIVSFLSTGGKCRYCHTKLSWRYPLVECICGLAFLANYLVFSLDFSFFWASLLACLLIIVAFIDIDTLEIYDRFHILLLLMGILEIFIFKTSFANHLLGSIVVALPYLILALVTGGIGGGDVKLVFSAGFLLGFPNILVAFLVACILAGIYAVILLLLKKADRQTAIPYGPFLCIGIYTAYLGGSALVQAYLSLFF